MLICEGYKMFRGSADILSANTKKPVLTLHGTWLYKPSNGFWYLNNCPDYPFGTSFEDQYVGNIHDEDEEDA